MADMILSKIFAFTFSIFVWKSLTLFYLERNENMSDMAILFAYHLVDDVCLADLDKYPH